MSEEKKIYFGRYKGRTYKEIWEKDREYCNYLCENIAK